MAFYFEAAHLNYSFEYSIILKIFVMFSSLQIVSSCNSIFLGLTELKKIQINVGVSNQELKSIILMFVFFLIILN